MSMEKKNKRINVLSDNSIIPNEPVMIHINYTEALTLKEFSEVLDLMNKAINDINRDKGIKSNIELGQNYSTKVTGVDSGSIVLFILTHFVSPVALSVLANYLYDRFIKLRVKKANRQNDSDYQISINVNGNNHSIEIIILNPIPVDNKKNE